MSITICSRTLRVLCCDTLCHNFIIDPFLTSLYMYALLATAAKSKHQTSIFWRWKCNDGIGIGGNQVVSQSSAMTFGLAYRSNMPSLDEINKYVDGLGCVNTASLLPLAVGASSLNLSSVFPAQICTCCR